MPDIRDLPVMCMADAQSIGFAGFNDVPHKPIDVPDGAFTIITKTSDGRRTTFSFQPYDTDGTARFCDIQFHDRGSTIPNANDGRSPTFDMFGITKGGRHIVDTRALTEDIKPSILVLLLDRQTEERPVAVPRLKSTMSDRDLGNLLNRVAAVIEAPSSEIRSDREDLVRQLTAEAAKRNPDL
ncbi:hypothetical protein [Sphingomonas solaris]|uniref:Uncharacterized protein n=1 Tax=Alterirhizorhabdus solaris TaxID=2529389 RepID=A0A558RC19_9SPHN|nr:hypothetical protein [Sphingomonas solaris]TVV76975.1 hypothetical protein FOY91_02745 [Sphingomonas solaris]